MIETKKSRSEAGFKTFTGYYQFENDSLQSRINSIVLKEGF